MEATMELGNWQSASLLPDGQARAVLSVANGMTSKEAGKLFGVSPNTINAALNQVREKLNGNYEITGKRGWIVSEAIRNGWLSPLMVLIMIASVLSGLVTSTQDIEMRRSSNRLQARSASRNIRSQRKNESLDVDFEFSDMTPESLLAFFDATPVNPNTNAPWSSVAWMQRDSFNNSERLELWRSGYEVIQSAA
jgi:hypothetical protein